MATEITQAVADRVASVIVNADMTKLQIAEKTGIPYSTLNRKLKGRGDFSFDELYLIATTTGVSPSAFLPAEFLAKAVA